MREQNIKRGNFWSKNIKRGVWYAVKWGFLQGLIINLKNASDFLNYYQLSR